MHCVHPVNGQAACDHHTAQDLCRFAVGGILCPPKLRRRRGTARQVSWTVLVIEDHVTRLLAPLRDRNTCDKRGRMGDVNDRP